MRKSFVAAVAIVAALAVAAPATAGPRDRATDPPSMSRLIKKIVSKVLGIKTTAEPIIPIPGPDKP